MYHEPNYIELAPKLTLKLCSPEYAADLFNLTDQNRDYLKTWLPWLDFTQEEAHSRNFLSNMQLQQQQGKGANYLIFADDELVGIVGFHSLNTLNKQGSLGYWLAESQRGQGIMVLAAAALVDLGFKHYQLHKIEIRAAVANQPSRRVAEKLGFLYEATLRDNEWLYDHFVDHAVYSLLASEHKAPQQENQ